MFGGSALSQSWQLQTGMHNPNASNMVIDEKFSRKTYTLFVDSRDRDVTKFPNQNSYTIPLEKIMKSDKIRNVTKVELKSICYPKVANEDYVVMSLDCLNGRVQSAGSAHNKFAICYFDRSNMDQGTSKAYFPSGCVRHFDNESISELKVQFTSHSGDLIRSKQITCIAEDQEERNIDGIVEYSFGDGNNNGLIEKYGDKIKLYKTADPSGEVGYIEGTEFDSNANITKYGSVVLKAPLDWNNDEHGTLDAYVKLKGPTDTGDSYLGVNIELTHPPHSFTLEVTVSQ